MRLPGPQPSQPPQRHERAAAAESDDAAVLLVELCGKLRDSQKSWRELYLTAGGNVGRALGSIVDTAPLAPRLVSLDLANTPVTELSPVAGLAHLKSPDISRTNNILGTGVHSLEPLYRIPSLRYLTAFGVRLADRDFRRLAAARPDLEIDR